MEAGSGLILVFEMLWKEILYEVEGTDSVTSRHQILSSLHFEEMQKKMGVMNSMEVELWNPTERKL